MANSPRLPLLLAGLAGLSLFGLWLGCTGDGDVKTTDGTTTAEVLPPDSPQDTLVIAELANFDKLISPVTQSVADARIIEAIGYSSTNAEFDCELKHTPGFYESWSFNEDHTVMSVALRQGVTWDDGTPVTAQDVAFTYDLIADPKVASPRLSYVEQMVEGKRPLVIDDYHLEFHFKNAYDEATMISHASFAIVQKSRLMGVDRESLRGNDYGTTPATDGPWRIESWEQGTKVVLVPNENFKGPKEMQPKLKRVIVKVVPEYSTRIVELEKGSLDLVSNVQVVDADRLAESHPEIKFYRRGWRSFDYVAYNSFDPADYTAKKAKDKEDLDWSTVKSHPILGDKAVRRALSRAVNVDKLIADLLTSKKTGESFARRAVSTVTPALCKWHNNDIVPIPYDPSGARAELAAAGWTDSNNDGVLDKDGRDLRFTLLTNSGNQRRNDAAIIMQANFKEIGVVMDIERVESNTLFDRLRKKDFDAALTGFGAALFPDMNSMWHSGERYEFNHGGYANPEVDRLIEQAVKESNSDTAASLTKQAQALIYEDQPFTFLYWLDEIVALHSRFRDARIDILSTWGDLYRWWVPTAEVKYDR